MFKIKRRENGYTTNGQFYAYYWEVLEQNYVYVSKNMDELVYFSGEQENRKVCQHTHFNSLRYIIKTLKQRNLEYEMDLNYVPEN